MKKKKVKFLILKHHNGYVIKVKMGWEHLWAWKVITEREHPDGTKPYQIFDTYDDALKFMYQDSVDYAFVLVT